jgi:hypothetical protein
MKLPNGDQAAIDPRKLTEYSLSADHDDGKHKAKLFRQVLGLDAGRVDELIRMLREAAVHAEAVLGRRDKYGQRYTVDFNFAGPDGTVVIRSAWIILNDESFPRLVTCYIL